MRSAFKDMQQNNYFQAAQPEYYSEEEEDISEEELEEEIEPVENSILPVPTRSIIGVKRSAPVVKLTGPPKGKKGKPSKARARTSKERKQEYVNSCPLLWNKDLSQVIPPDGNVLIQGPSGKGKTRLVQFLLDCIQNTQNNRIGLKDQAPDALILISNGEVLAILNNGNRQWPMISEEHVVKYVRKYSVVEVPVKDNEGNVKLNKKTNEPVMKKIKQPREETREITGSDLIKYLSEGINQGRKMIVLFDDVQGNKKDFHVEDNTNPVNFIFTEGRSKLIRAFFIAQDWAVVPPAVRRNAHAIICYEAPVSSVGKDITSRCQTPVWNHGDLMWIFRQVLIKHRIETKDKGGERCWPFLHIPTGGGAQYAIGCYALSPKILGVKKV